MPAWGSRSVFARSRPGWPLPARRPDLYRFLFRRESESQARGELSRDARLAAIEAVLIAADEPLTPKRLAQAADISDVALAKTLIKKLQALYDLDGTAFQVEEVAGGYQLLTRSEFHSWLVRMRRGGKDVKITGAARETLAIIAYRQPIRADIEAIRGVQCSEVLRQLMEKGLVRMAGRQETLGRPQLYGTTKKFLQMFGLKSLKDLPTAPDLAPKPVPVE